MSKYSNLLIVDNYTATSAAGMTQYENTIIVDAIPSEADTDANGKSYMMPVVLTNGTDTITTVATAWDTDTLTLAYSAPAGGMDGPITVICAPNALVHRSVALRQMEREESYAVTNHYPRLGMHNHLYASGYLGNAHTVNLPQPSDYPGYVNIVIPVLYAPIVSLFLIFDSSSQTVSFVSPAGYTLLWADALPPELSAGRTKLLVELQYSGGTGVSAILGSWRAFA